MLYIVPQYDEILFSYNMAPLFALSMDKGQADSLCYLCNKLLRGGKDEEVAFSGVLSEQLNGQ